MYGGEDHTFLGRKVRIREDIRIEIEMKYQLMESIEMFEEEVTNSVI